MKNEILIEKIKTYKNDRECTLHELSKILDIQVSTIERWFRTKRINRLYAQKVQEKLNL